MKALLSIKPQFVEEIVAGNKLYEYRKKIFKKDVDTVVIYSSKPVGRIIGEFLIDEILSDEPSSLWDETSKYSGISKDLFFEYFRGRKDAYAIKIKNLTLYPKQIDPKEIMDNFTAPQSYMYLDDDVLKVCIG